MAGDLLHLIREAERIAKNEINDAELEAKRIIREAESLAQNKLSQLDSSTDLSTGDIKVKIDNLVEKLRHDMDKHASLIRDQAAANHDSGVNYVIRSLLELA